MQLKHTLLLLLFGCVAALSCEGDEETSAVALLGEGCLLNSDCNDELVCVFRRCHIECEDSGDCPLSADGERLRCVLGDKPEHVCQLEDETHCAYNSECPGQQVCGPDGRCRDQCQADRDCVAGQTCVEQGVCADPEEVDGGGLSYQAPPGEQTTGAPCLYDSQCEGLAPEGGPRFVCVDGGCNYGCYTSVDCEPNFGCQPDDGDAATPGECVYLGGGTTVPCVPGHQIACDCYGDPMAVGVQKCNDEGTMFGPCTSATDPNCALPSN